MSSSSADAVAIADIWAGRDPDTTIASAADLAAADPGPPARDRRSSPRARSTRPPTAWPRRSERGDVVLVMGGGASYRIGERLLTRLEVTR